MIESKEEVFGNWYIREWSLFNNRGGLLDFRASAQFFFRAPPYSGQNFPDPPLKHGNIFEAPPPLNYSNARAFLLKRGEISQAPPLEESAFLRPPSLEGSTFLGPPPNPLTPPC